MRRTLSSEHETARSVLACGSICLSLPIRTPSSRSTAGCTLSAGTVYLVNHASIHSAVNGAPQLVRRPIVVRDNAVPRRGKRHRAACPAALKVGHLSMAAATAHYMQL